MEPRDYNYRRAEGYDYNRSGKVSQDELPRTAAATRVLDKNWDNAVSVWELADGFRRGDVKIRGGELRAWHESDSTYRPYQPSRPHHDRPRYDDRPYRRSTEGEDIVGGAIVGGLLGGLAGAILGGEDGAAVGAIIGGTAGAVSGIRK